MLLNAIQLMQNYNAQIPGVKTVVNTFARVWVADEYYVTNRVVRPSSETGFFYKALNDGLVGSTEPSWPTSLGGQVVDNEITWEAVEEDVRGWPTTALNPASFPLVLLSENSGGRWEQKAGDSYNSRAFDMHIFLHPQEVHYYPIARNDVLLYLQRFGAAWSNPSNKVLSSGTNTVIVQNYTGSDGIVDSGLIVLEYSGEEYYGFTVNVRVEIAEKR